MTYDSAVQIGRRKIAADQPTYFIADLASNHDGDLGRAQRLIELAAEAGADAAKFQHFKAKKIVSDHGFRSLERMSHQQSWAKSVFEVYEECELNRAWDQALATTAARVGIDFMTSPYDHDAIVSTAPLVAAFKIGSGEITWIDAMVEIAKQGKPVLLATGAATMEDVERAVTAITEINPAFVLMQCNTNYTGSLDNFRCINLRVLKTFEERWPGMVLGLSDHTPGHATVLGAVALGARVVEKHFTDDNSRVGPDHGFSMNPRTWREMVDRTRELEAAMGDGIKRIEANERDPSVVQRRSLHVTRPLAVGHVLTAADFEPLRPAPAGSIPPYLAHAVVGKTLLADKADGQCLTRSDVGLDNDLR